MVGDFGNVLDDLEGGVICVIVEGLGFGVGVEVDRVVVDEGCDFVVDENCGGVVVIFGGGKERDVFDDVESG